MYALTCAVAKTMSSTCTRFGACYCVSEKHGSEAEAEIARRAHEGEKQKGGLVTMGAGDSGRGWWEDPPKR